MIKVDFIVSKSGNGAEIAYPLIKFGRALLNSGIKVRIKHQFPEINSTKPDVLILTYPYFRNQFPSNPAFTAVSDQMLRDAFQFAKKTSEKVIFFETTDSTACLYLSYLSCVDLILKKQILRDTSHYCTDEYGQRPYIWLEKQKTPCQIANRSEIGKLAIGWNLAYRNYSLFSRGTRYVHWRGLTWDPRFTRVDRKRALLTFFRGGMAGTRANHRQTAIDILNTMNHDRIQTGLPVSRLFYVRDLKNSQVVVSPFGYGEPCFRDMEAFIHGAILVKPSMEHVATFPDIYTMNETYVPVNWDFSDLEDTLLTIEENYPDFLHIAERGQAAYKKHIKDSNLFVDHFKGIIRSVLM